ncbi:hypothetical protein AWC38_SpisGene7556 [Stylophora pistillata]|uniref:C2H2-type domain-containing protein n=1 Tax=Stylophora pistillata TaxID=50429 RepID=A0A2B4SGX4_STYPI|nr:hypothetical protein AWC38_SpisGene7556 [Stylophora pistillata]
MGVRLSLLGISALLRLATVVTEAPRSTGSDIRDTTKWTVVEFDKRNVSLPCAVDTSGLPLLHVGWYMCRIQMIQECRSGSEKRKIAHIENMSNVSIVRPDEFDLTLNGSLIILRILSKYNKMIFLCKGKVRFHRHHENFTILHLVFPSTSRPSLRPTTPDIPIATGPSSSVLEQAEIPSIEATILKHQLRWGGHVSPMEDHRLPKIVMYGELSTGHRVRGAPKKRFKGSLKKSLSTCNIDHKEWSDLATDRGTWHHTINQATAQFEEDRRELLKDKRQRRKARPASTITPDITLLCRYCPRICLSRIGLVSHERACSRRQRGQPS